MAEVGTVAAGMAEVGTVAAGMAAGAVVAGAGAVSASASGPGCLSPLLLALLTTAATATTMIPTMATGLLTATVAPIMATAATTRATDTQPTPIVVITIAMVGTTHIAGTPIVENRAALDHQGKTAVKAVFLFCSLLAFRQRKKHAGLPSRHIRVGGGVSPWSNIIGQP